MTLGPHYCNLCLPPGVSIHLTANVQTSTTPVPHTRIPAVEGISCISVLCTKFLTLPHSQSQGCTPQLQACGHVLWGQLMW